MRKAATRGQVVRERPSQELRGSRDSLLDLLDLHGQPLLGPSRQDSADTALAQLINRAQHAQQLGTCSGLEGLCCMGFGATEAALPRGLAIIAGRAAIRGSALEGLHSHAKVLQSCCHVHESAGTGCRQTGCPRTFATRGSICVMPRVPVNAH